MNTARLMSFLLVLITACSSAHAELNPKTFYGDSAENLYTTLRLSGAKREINYQLYPYYVAHDVTCSKEVQYHRGDNAHEPAYYLVYKCKFSNNGREILLEESLADDLYHSLFEQNAYGYISLNMHTINVKSIACKAGTNLANGKPHFYLCSIRK